MYIPLKPLFSRHKGIGVQFTDVLIGLVIIFKSQITALVNKLLSKMSSQANKI